jgi:SAM-dependent MidA family methyltransferase
VSGHRSRSYVGARLDPDGRVTPVPTPPGGWAGDSPAAATAGSAEDDPVLVDEIRRQIEAAGGRLTFARFMELALYHPERGYYSTSAERPTRGGDFLTAPEVHPMFGRLLARQLDEMWRRLAQPEPFVVREHGAGRGALAASILAGLTAEGSGLVDTVRYEPVDRGDRTETARAHIRAAGFEQALGDDGGRVRIEPPISGCILANELLDALPVHRLGRQDGELVEWYVVWREGRFHEEPGKPSDTALVEHLERAGIALREGQRVEVSLAAGTWIRSAAASLERGYLVLIDYGYPVGQLYGVRRHGGTLRAFRGHHVSDDPFRAVGRQDLTAHVDLTTTERVGREAGLTLLGQTTQAEFLIGLGLGDLLHDAQQAAFQDLPTLLSARTAAARFIDPGALGGFAVLIFGRGVERDPPLRGLAFRVPRPT